MTGGASTGDPAHAESVDGDWPLRRLLSEVVGSGPRSAGDMRYEQAREAFARLLDGDPDPTTVGAFLLATRWKDSTPEELAGFLDAMRARSVRPVAPTVDPVDCGANYDGKADTAVRGVAAGLVAAAAGTPVVVHSADRVPSKAGVAYRHVLDELGVVTDLDPADSAEMAESVGFGFYDATRFNPGVEALLDRRAAMGVRTVVNAVETLANPADAAVHLGSFYHLAYARKLAETVAESRTLDHDRVLLVQGMEGYDDVRTGFATLAEFDGDLTDREIDTAAFGLDADRETLEVDDVAADSAVITEAVLAGEREDAFADAVALDAGLRVYARRDAPTLDAAVEAARDAIADGSAAARLADLRAFEPAGPGASAGPAGTGGTEDVEG